MRVIISAGGTGGHIYPALSIINKIKKEDKDSKILYIGTTDRMEKDIIPSNNIDYYGIKMRGIDRKLSLKNLITIKYFISAVIETKKIIKDFKPDIVIGVGGYVTAPVIYAAHLCKVKTLIHEQNSSLGMTNKFLSKYVNKVALSFKDTAVKNGKGVYTGNPSSEITNIPFDKKELGLSKDKKLVLIVMGSLGSNSINNLMKDILLKFNNKDYEILFVTGKNYYDEFKNIKFSKNIFIVPFIDNMKKVFKSVDVLVTRAGATTLSEILSYKVPSILIPSPYVTDNHQYKNALMLVNNNAARLIREDELNFDILVKNIEQILYNKSISDDIKKNLSNILITDGSSKIYDLIKEIIGE